MVEFEKKFSEMKRDLGFKATLNDLDEIFYLRDFIYSEGYVSNFLSRQIASRITNTYMNWNNYLLALVFTSHGNMILMTEAKKFNEEEKKHLTKLVASSMGIISTNTLIGITKNKEEESKFFDDSLNFWNTTFKPEIEKVMVKVNEAWLNKS